MIVSTTLVGPGTLDVLDDALASVRDQVDVCILIPTSPDVRDEDLRHAALRAGAGKRYQIARFDWRDDFSAARNFALDAAFGVGATWAVTLDTDERLHFDDIDLRQRLAGTKSDVVMALQVDGSYAKERCLRLAKVAVRGIRSGLIWRGATHECLPLVDGATRETSVGITFSELPKSPEQLTAKFERDRQILQAELVATPPGPGNARAWYYLGECYHGLGDIEQAVFAFTTCAEFSGWHEEAAWSRYRCADLECRRSRFDHAIEHAALGLVKHAGMAELSWIAGIAAFRAGRFEQAIHWATLSASTGWFSGTGRWIDRVGFRHPPALWEGPYDILAHAYEVLEQHDQAARARAKWKSAERLRVKGDAAAPDDD